MDKIMKQNRGQELVTRDFHVTKQVQKFFY